MLNLRKLFLSGIFAIGLFFVSSFVEAASPVGAVVSSDYSYITGYACDPDNYTVPIQVHFYADYPAGNIETTYLGNIVADESGDATVSAACGGNSAHAFSFITPESLKGNMPHIVFAYGIDLGPDANVILENSPAVVNAPLPQVPQIQFEGTPENVYDWTYGCEVEDVPDIAAKAFRDADGKVHLISSHTNSRENIGNTLNTVAHTCNIVMTSEKNTNYYNYKYNEWISSPYTLDGINIYALIHNEWYSSVSGLSCFENNPANCWVNSVTLVKSIDKGLHYVHPASYLVATPPVPWQADDGSRNTRFGSFTPSNIVKYGDYYYTSYRSLDYPGIINHSLESGPCLMRTKDISLASSWEKLTENGWIKNVAATCKPLEGLELPIHSLTYSNHLDAFVATLYQLNDGVYMAYSKNLLTWRRAKVLNVPDKYHYRYPSLLDPLDTSRNFEVIGQEPYLYYVEYMDHEDSSPDEMNRDLRRVKISFNDITSPDTFINSNPPAVNDQTSAVFNFSSDESGTFMCKLDAGVYASCTSPKSYTNLSQSMHTFSVKAIDDASNEDPTPAIYTWLIDLSPSTPTGLNVL